MRVSFVFHLYMYIHFSLPTIPCVLWSLHIVISCIINWTEPQLWLGKCWLINRLQRISCLWFCVLSHSVGLHLLHLFRCFCYLQPLEIESQFHVIRTKRGNTSLKTSDRSSGRFPKMTASEQSPWEGGLCVCRLKHNHTDNRLQHAGPLTTGGEIRFTVSVRRQASVPIRHNDKQCGNNVSYVTRLIFVLLMLARFLCALVQLGLQEGQSRCAEKTLKNSVIVEILVG